MAAKVRKGDKVIVISGVDKGKAGEVMRVLPEKGRVFVSGVNMIKRHNKQTYNTQAGIVEREGSVSASNVMHVDPKNGKATKVGFKILKDGKKVRFAKKSGEIIDS